MFCEIYYNDREVAELSNKKGRMILTMFSQTSGEAWTFQLEDFLEVIEIAKNRLLGKPP